MGEKHHCVVASHMPPTGDLAATQACALTGNQTGDPLVHRSALNPLSCTSQGWVVVFYGNSLSCMFILYTVLYILQWEGLKYICVYTQYTHSQIPK